MKKYGFTLAEVLITLALIGVVASMTLPSLNSSVQKKSYEAGAKKAYNTIMNAVGLYMTDQGVDDLTETPITTQAGLEEFVRQYFKVTFECTQQNYSKNGVSCFPEKYYSLDHSASFNMANGQCMMNVMTADGMSICFDTAPMKDSDYTDEDGNSSTSHSSFGVTSPADTVFAAEFDMNGQQGPNTFGRDHFAVSLDRHGTPLRVADNGCDTTTSAGRAACVTRYKKNAISVPINLLLHNGWKMDY